MRRQWILVDCLQAIVNLCFCPRGESQAELYWVWSIWQYAETLIKGVCDEPWLPLEFVVESALTAPAGIRFVDSLPVIASLDTPANSGIMPGLDTYDHEVAREPRGVRRLDRQQYPN